MDQDVCPSDASVLTVDEPDGSPVVVAFFAGLGGGHPFFEFRRTAAAIRAHKVFLRDLEGHWYQDGLPGAGDDADELAAFLRGHCARLGASRLVTIGNSAGGYAAILFGILAGADEVHAFAPKARILTAADFHDPRKLARLEAAMRTERPHRDLTALLREGRGASTAIHVHYPSGHAIDVAQAALFAGLPQVTLWEYPWRRHTVVKALAQRGVLKKIIENAATGDPRRLRLLAMQGRWLIRAHALYSRVTGRPEVTKSVPAEDD